MHRLLALLLVALALAAGGCASGPSAETITLPRIPAWQPPTDARIFTAQEVRAELELLVPPGASVRFSDGHYTLVSYEWLQRYLAWTWEAAKADGLEYTPESFDCEDFADAFALFVRRAAARAGVRASPLVPTLTVIQSTAWAHVPAGGAHEVSAVATDRGHFVIEPQPDAGPFRTVALAAYPNYILEVKYGK